MNQKKLYHWVEKVSKDWQGVTRHFRENVRVFTQGVARSKSSHLRQIAGSSGGNADSQRRRLQRFVGNSKPLEAFFTSWTRSVIKALASDEVVLVVDETKLEDRLGVMVVGVAYKERCIPLAWRVYRANSSEDYPAEGQNEMILTLLKHVKAGMPAKKRVLVVTDRGIGMSSDLMRGIMEMGWTFLFRVTKQSKIVLPDGQELCFHAQVTAPGQSYQASGTVFKKRGHIPGHVRVLWGEEAKEPWALVTNDESIDGWDYAQRMWIEESFRDLKSHGWQVEESSLEDPERMARLWVLLVVAYAWMLFWGAMLEMEGKTCARKKRKDGSYVRRWSLFREGQQAFISDSPPR